MTVLELTPVEERERIAGNLREITEIGDLIFERTLVGRDGKRVTIEVNSRLIEVEGRNVILSQVRDLTERNRVERALREVEERFRQLAENIDEVFWLTDPEKNVMLYVSPGFERVWGRSTESLHASPRDWLDAIHPEDRQRVAAAAVTKQRAGTYDEEYRIVRPDGSQRWIRDRAFPVRDAAGAVYRIAGIAGDITERKRSELLLSGHRRTLELIASGAPLGQSLEVLVRVIEEQVPEMLGSVLLLDDDGLHLRHGAAPSLPQSYIEAIDGVAIGPRAGSCGTAAYRREQVVVEDIATDPLWEDYRDYALPHGLRACWSTPIFDTEQRVLGTFAMYFSTPRAPAEEHFRIIESATYTAAIAIAQAREETALRASAERQRALSRRVLEVQEAERRALARELHDEVGGVLTALKLNLQALQRRQAADRFDEVLGDGLTLVDGAIQSVRSMSLDLRPVMLDDLGLIPALKWYCERQAARSDVQIELALEAIDLKSAPSLESTCFRIVQESVTNALRYANARCVDVTLLRTDGSLSLEIADDGGGFDVAAARKRSRAGASTGLVAMEERAQLLGGRFSVDSAPGAGTRVRAEFTISEGGFD